jgi:hypothetical protein
MHTHTSTTLTFESSDAPSVIPSAELQQVCLSAFGFGIWFTTEQIPQIEQLLNLLWAMKDEQERQLEELEEQWEVKQETEYYLALAEF